jgi:hypothetical protein
MSMHRIVLATREDVPTSASGIEMGIVSTAGGARMSPDRGDYVIDYALPGGEAAP